jgi:threonine dehydrogenase-like Zn-dependent dehydrogenase
MYVIRSAVMIPARGESLSMNPRIDPGKVFDLQLPLEQAAAGYQAMDQREAIKLLLHP